MGLDNGLMLHSRNMIKAAERPPKVTSLGGYDDYDGKPMFDYEVLYYRKCWNIRNKVANILDLSRDYVQKYDLSIDDVKQIWHIINELNSPNTWESQGGSIWTYEEIKDHLDSDLLSLEWLIYYMRNHKEDEYMVEFYDKFVYATIKVNFATTVNDALSDVFDYLWQSVCTNMRMSFVENFVLSTVVVEYLEYTLCITTFF